MQKSQQSPMRALGAQVATQPKKDTPYEMIKKARPENRSFLAREVLDELSNPSEIKKVEEALSSNNTEQMKSATDSLNKTWNEIASQLYSQAGGPQGQGEPGQGAPGGQQQPGGQTEEGKENVQDASYEVVDEEEEKNKNKK